MKSITRALPMLAALAALAAACISSPAERPEPSEPGAASDWGQATELPDGVRAEILWDRYGVPHIHARDTESLLYGYGWAQARAHADTVLFLYGLGRGRAAEYWGERALDHDRWVHTIGLPDRAAALYASRPDSVRRYLDAFADGFNAYVRAHPDHVGEHVRAVLPVSGEDALRQGMAVGQLFSNARAVARQWEQRPVSNAWAIAPQRSATGNALLLANPHLPWRDAFLFFEARWSAPGIDAYGATLVGLPALGIAFNRDLGWTHTVNTQDTEDLYRLHLDDAGGGPGSGYRWDEGVRAFQVDSVWIRVRGEGGAPADSVLHVRRRSVHGPVVVEGEGLALALRQVESGWAETVERGLELVRARTLADFEAAMARSMIAGFNIVYADRAGNILYHYGGTTPRRPRGDYGFWAGIVPGDTSALLWTGTHDYHEMPRVVNPEAGFVQNANEPPWHATLPAPLDPAAFPPYFAPTMALPARPRQSLRLLADDSPLTLDEMIRRASSTEVELATRLVPDLVRVAREQGGGDEGGGGILAAAAAVLETWDRTADAGSRGGVLFDEWLGRYLRLAGGRAFAEPWTPADPLGSPRGLGDPAAAVAALEQAAAEVVERWGTMALPWGEVHRIRHGGEDLPASGGSGGLGLFRVLSFAPDEDGRRRVTHGDSYIAAIEFSTPVRARSLLVYGNASQPGSPHRTDQLGYHLRKELRPVWLTRAEVEANLSKREVLR
jgi:acyl-homoserine-lactone acylase